MTYEEKLNLASYFLHENLQNTVKLWSFMRFLS